MLQIDAGGSFSQLREFDFVIGERAGAGALVLCGSFNYGQSKNDGNLALGTPRVPHHQGAGLRVDERYSGGSFHAAGGGDGGGKRKRAASGETARWR